MKSMSQIRTVQGAVWTSAQNSSGARGHLSDEKATSLHGLECDALLSLS